jgi:hypothetical protein
MSSQSAVYRVLEQIRNGDPVASAQLLPLVYQELREATNSCRTHRPTQLWAFGPIPTEHTSRDNELSAD